MKPEDIETTMCPRNREQLKEWDRQHVWHGFTQMAEYRPFVIERADGCYLTDIDGKVYLDGVSSLWCNVHGHNHPRLNAALERQLHRVSHTTSLGMSADITIEFAHELSQWLPDGLDRIFFSDSGSTAVEVAIKMALQYWQQRADPRPEKTRYAAFELAYHGDTVGGVSLGGISRFHEIFRPLLFQPLRLPVPLPQGQASSVPRNDEREEISNNSVVQSPISRVAHPPTTTEQHRQRPQFWRTWRTPASQRTGGATAYTDADLEDASRKTLAEIEAVFRRHHHELAAVVIEPLLQGAGGMILHPPGFLRGLRKLTHAYDILLVLDEVAVGFGRTGRMFACEHEGVVPDFLCLAKGISGGYLPMAVTATHQRIWEAFLGSFSESKTFFHGHTYGGNPLACAVALENLRIFAEEVTLERMQPSVQRLRQHLEQLAALPGVGEVRQVGMIAAVELVRDQQTCEVPPWEERFGQRVCDHARQAGVWLRPLGNVVVIMPPLSISIEQIDQLAAAVRDGIAALSAERMLPAV